MFPDRLSCMHCKANFTMAFALKNHFDRGTCPVLLMNWVRDAHYGPKLIMSRHHHCLASRSRCRPRALIRPGPAVQCSAQIAIRSWPWDINCMHHWSLYPISSWMSPALIHRCHEMDDSLSGIASGCTLLGHCALHYSMDCGAGPFPVHWAWNSDSPDTWWDPRTINMDTDPHDQVSWFRTTILELEHALARDFVLSAASEHGRQYVNGRYVICRPPAHTPSPSQAPSHGARVISGQNSWERQIETPIRLLNHLFEARRGFGAFDDAGQVDLTPGEHDQSDGLGQKFPAVSAGRTGLHPTGHDPGSQGVASSATEHWCHLLLSTGQFPQSGLIQRLTKLKYDSPDDPLVQALRQKGILTAENAWNYLS